MFVVTLSIFFLIVGNVECANSISEAQTVLNWHNEFRAMVAKGEVDGQPSASNMIAMEWDDRVEQNAKNWAEACSSSFHNTAEDRLFGIYPVVGQNFAGSSDRTLNKAFLFDQWANEHKDYSFTSGKAKCNGCVIGHYTQLVWWRSALLGCHLATCEGTSTMSKFICDYAMGGNIVGVKPYSQGAPCSDCPAGYGFCMDGALCARKRACDGSPSSQCKCSLSSTKCLNGVFDSTQCFCRCSPGWKGSNCDEKCEDIIQYCESFVTDCVPSGNYYARYFAWFDKSCQLTCDRCQMIELGDTAHSNTKSIGSASGSSASTGTGTSQDCTWQAWQEWSTCSTSCESGFRSRIRSSIKETGQGKPCTGDSTQAEVCNENLKCTVSRDCSWQEWQEWSSCSTSCESGVRSRIRTSTKEIGQGNPCIGDSIEAEVCNQNVPCTVSRDCTWLSWNSWGSCSASCGTGVRSRTRGQIGATGSGKSCFGDADETWSCNTQVCPRDCVWRNWESWSVCSETCGGGIKSRSRTKLAGTSDGAPCSGADTEFINCNIQSCSKDCSWLEWRGWSLCSKSCGGGLQTRYREKLPESGGGNPCLGSGTDTNVCGTATCRRDCVWDSWGQWSTCTQSCNGGSQVRQRLKTIEVGEGRPCFGDNQQSQTCNTVPCPRGCIWSVWQPWTCSVTCDFGIFSRLRKKTFVSNSESECLGDSIQRASCDTKVPCNIPKSQSCKWNPWGSWSACSVTCKGGTQSRQRTKIEATGSGLDCLGESTELTYCNFEKPCTDFPQDCLWTDWESWSPCSASCLGGSQRRIRTRVREASNGGRPCLGLSSDTRTCNDIICSSDCKWNAWQSWSTCSRTCGLGSLVRFRTAVQATDGGRPCNGSNSELKTCTLRACTTSAPRGCMWTDWSDWSACSKTCESGAQSRSRVALGSLDALGRPCNPEDYEYQSCNQNEICDRATACSWDKWSDCSVTCGNGTMVRYRTVDDGANGKPVACSGGETKQVSDCFMKTCRGGVVISSQLKDCSDKPCQNGGRCYSAFDSFYCDCKRGTFGVYCENHLRACSKEPCQNGGKCVAGLGNSYLCECKDGFMGTHCEYNNEECVRRCDSNRGVCLIVKNKLTCVCSLRYKGDFCEEVKT